VAEDTAIDRVAIVEFTSSKGGDFTIEVELYGANTASFVSFVVLRDGGWTIPRSDLSIAQNGVMDRAGYMNQDVELDGRYVKFNDGVAQACIFGGLIAGGDGAFLTNLNLGDGDARLIAEGDSDVQDIDLILYDSADYELDADRLTDAHPRIDEYTSSYQTYNVEIANQAGIDSTPTFCIVAVLQIRP
jgi:hypothetical protein